MNKKSIVQIKAEFEQAGPARRNVLYGIYGSDERAGVQKLIAGYRKKEETLRAERERLDAMYSYERKYSGYRLWQARWWRERSSCPETARSFI